MNDLRHKAIDPSRIVLAGDSAGAALCLSLLCLLRDMDLPLPAGGMCTLNKNAPQADRGFSAALVSPWCDLTESFPSIMENVRDLLTTYSKMKTQIEQVKTDVIREFPFT